MVAVKGRPRVLVLRAAGTNCDAETAFAFEHAGAAAEQVHINRLVSGEKKLRDYHILAVPGGFTYGDDVASGKILANELKYKLATDLEKFIGAGKLIIGICNGFQVLVKAGLLPGKGEGGEHLEATLTTNDTAR
nr:phosphoribosylformylglycinamidine synthase subunit PurQ [Candidatus Omnitrophota bacterium]